MAASPTIPMGYQRTSIAVAAQASCMNCERYDIGLREASSHRMLRREWTLPQLLKSLSYLRHMNGQGRDIYIRPATLSPLVLVDDLSRRGVMNLWRDDPTLACVVRTSLNNYQAWVHVFESKPTLHQLNRVALQLARFYGGDVAAANYRQYGRLAGFTNRKPRHMQQTGQYPYVQLVSRSELGLEPLPINIQPLPP